MEPSAINTASKTITKNFFQTLCSDFELLLDIVAQNAQILSVFHGEINTKFIEKLQLCWCSHGREIKRKWSLVSELGLTDFFSKELPLQISDQEIEKRVETIVSLESSDSYFMRGWMSILDLLAIYTSGIAEDSAFMRQFFGNWKRYRDQCLELWLNALELPTPTSVYTPQEQYGEPVTKLPTSAPGEDNRPNFDNSFTSGHFNAMTKPWETMTNQELMSLLSAKPASPKLAWSVEQQSENSRKDQGVNRRTDEGAALERVPEQNRMPQYWGHSVVGAAGSLEQSHGSKPKTQPCTFDKLVTEAKGSLLEENVRWAMPAFQKKPAISERSSAARTNTPAPPCGTFAKTSTLADTPSKHDVSSRDQSLSASPKEVTRPSAPDRRTAQSYQTVMAKTQTAPSQISHSFTKGRNQIPNMELPIQLIATSSNGKLELCEPAARILRTITAPVAVVAIAGKYRTGKSYLLNRLAGSSSGFGLGSTIQPETKGIWMWAKPHPRDPSQCLLLLDTEGLYDVEKEDRAHDLHIFTLTVLLSTCLVYNATGTLDDVFIRELDLVAELAETIRVRKGQDDDNQGARFSYYFPTLLVVLRDFFLELKLNGQEITTDEYLENSLKLKRGQSKKFQQYNAPREGIRKYFPRRKCFALPKPVEKDHMLRDLDSHTDSELVPEFIDKCREAVVGILDELRPMSIDGNSIYGPGFLELTQEYTRAFNENRVPCIQSALDVMKQSECRRACDQALQLYTQEMGGLLSNKLPMATSRLNQLHYGSQMNAFAAYRRFSVFDTEGAFSKKFEEDIEKQLQLFVKENKDVSFTKCNEAIQICFSELEENYSKGLFSSSGGHAKFLMCQRTAKADYMSATGLGPMKEEVLQKYLKENSRREESIIATDQVLTENERKEAELRRSLREKEEQWKLEQAERERMRKENLRQQKQHTDFVESLINDYHNKQEELIKEHENAMRIRRQEYEELVEDKLEQQAREHERMISRMERESKQRQREGKEQRKQMEQYSREIKELQKRQREKEREYERERQAMIQESRDSKKRDIEARKRLMKQQEARERQHQLEMQQLEEEQEQARERNREREEEEEEEEEEEITGHMRQAMQQHQILQGMMQPQANMVFMPTYPHFNRWF